MKSWQPVLLNCPKRELFRDRCAVLRPEPPSRFERSLSVANADSGLGNEGSTTMLKYGHLSQVLPLQILGLEKFSSLVYCDGLALMPRQAVSDAPLAAFPVTNESRQACVDLGCTQVGDELELV